MEAHTFWMAISTLSIHSTIFWYLKGINLFLISLQGNPPGVVDLSDKGVVLLPESHLASLSASPALHPTLPYQDMLTDISLTTLLLASMDNKQ